MTINNSLILDYKNERFKHSVIIHADCLEWLSRIEENSLHAIVTDPPYGVKEYDSLELEKRANGCGGIWRIPPSFDGHVRSPIPRFTALEEKDRKRITILFTEWTQLVMKVLRPGGHIFIATNSFIAPLLYEAMQIGGAEFRGQIIRLVRTLRGGDRPKNAENEFPEVSSLPRGCYEPWGIFRKPLYKKMKVSDCLKEFQTGGIRRLPNGKPFEDVIFSERTPRIEKSIANHPSLKPQSFLRKIVYAVLPLGTGIIADPFMGSGSTIAAAEALGLNSIGIERYYDYYNMANKTIPKLSKISFSNGVNPSKAKQNVPTFQEESLFSYR